MALRLRQMELSVKTAHGPVLKITQLSAHAQNHVSIKRCRKYFTTIVFGDLNFTLTASNIGNLTAFRAILAIFSLCLRITIFPWFEDVFCWFLHWISWCPPHFYIRSSCPTDLQSVSRDAHLAMKVSTKFEVDTTVRCLVIALLLLIRYVTLWAWPLTFWLWSVVIHGGSRGQPLHRVWRSYG